MLFLHPTFISTVYRLRLLYLFFIIIGGGGEEEEVCSGRYIQNLKSPCHEAEPCDPMENKFGGNLKHFIVV